ncbi:41301_t:CDS:2, partial [Gigaspora margarita]
MILNRFIIPDISDIFQELPYKQQLVLSSTMPQVDMHGSIIVRPLSNIQTFIDTYFQYTISTTSYYIVLSNDSDTSRLVFSTNAASNTTVHLHILDPSYESTNTTMHILVSNCKAILELTISKIVVFLDSLGLGISVPGSSNLNNLSDSELQTPNQIDISSYTPAVTPLKIIKRTTSSIYSVSSTTVS